MSTTQLNPQQQKHQDTYTRLRNTLTRTGADTGVLLSEKPNSAQLDRLFRNVQSWNMMEPMRDSLALAARRLCLGNQAADPSNEDAEAVRHLDQFDRCCENLDVVLAFEKARLNLQTAQVIAAKLPHQPRVEIERDNARRAFVEVQKQFEKATGIKTAS